MPDLTCLTITLRSRGTESAAAIRYPSSLSRARTSPGGGAGTTRRSAGGYFAAVLAEQKEMSEILGVI